MGKWAGRGRPKTRSDGKDLGTPELQKKKRGGMAGEPVDVCLTKGLITEEEHWCALHFRWLYTIRYGLPTVTAINLDGLYASAARLESSEWEESREAEYHEAADVLVRNHVHRDIINFAVQNCAPPFLLPYDERNFREAEASLARIKSGLQALSSLWIKGSRRNHQPRAAQEKRAEQQHLHQ